MFTDIKNDYANIVKGVLDNTKLDNSSREYNISRSGLWLKFIENDQIYQVLAMDKNGIFIIDRYIIWKELLKYHSFLDNSPCGKEIEKY